jgi:serine/threonine-protein kinase
MIAGSPSYIAPEVWRTGPYDHRIDVYSLGAIVFRALAGQVPFEGESQIDLLRKVISSERPKLSTARPDLPVELDAWVARALAIKAEDRFPYVSSMWNDLIRILMEGDSPSAQRVRATFTLPMVESARISAPPSDPYAASGNPSSGGGYRNLQ